MSAGAVAGVAGWRRRRLLWRAAVLAALGGAALVAMPLLVIGQVLSLPGGSRIAEPTGLPTAAREWIPLVNIAGGAYGVNPYLLLAILQEETAFGTHPDTYGTNFAGCCQGPFQMNVTDGPPSTWDLVKDAYRAAPRPARYLHPATPHPSVYDSFDAAMAAAQLLRRKAARNPLIALDAAAWQAARAYNGAGPAANAYADRVLAAARRWSVAQLRPAGPPTPAGELLWPVRGRVVSGFGMRWGRLHAGVDIAVPAGTPILAAAAGRVLLRGPAEGYGNFTCVAHARRLATCYAHLSRFAPGLTVGGVVLAGEVIGYAGCTGRCFGDHLHFEVHTSTTISSNTAVDPMPYLRGGQ